ncbi:hypothetical protein PMG11_06694 [Penicillium brasilianum]|uniref:C2H2-type domain-containing protein n=1 Tax=Penicillium brasilianum TaxID=104259 RepID=A0A0F7TSP0_PENBI|nr:hypothetical protein PMG11_06694 [Penicillium brasilianum]
MPPAEGGSSTSAGLEQAYLFLSTPRNLLDPIFAWSYPFSPFGSGLQGWTACNYTPLIGQGSAFPTSGPITTQAWMRNPDSQSQEPLPIIPSTDDVLSVFSTRNSSPIEAQLPTKGPKAIQEQGSGNDQQVDTQSSSQGVSFKCKWQGCTHTGTFGAKSSLWRHIDSTHVSPDSLRCPGCKKTFGRRDKYNAHVRLVHRDRADLIDSLGRSNCA